MELAPIRPWRLQRPQQLVILPLREPITTLELVAVVEECVINVRSTECSDWPVLEQLPARLVANPNNIIRIRRVELWDQLAVE